MGQNGSVLSFSTVEANVVRRCCCCIIREDIGGANAQHGLAHEESAKVANAAMEEEIVLFILICV